MTLKEMFEKVMKEYREVKGTKCNSANPYYKKWKGLRTNIIHAIMAHSGLNFDDTYISDLQKDKTAAIPGNSGNWADVFGVSIRHKNVPKVTAGVYITYLFNRDTSECYLILAQGADEYGNRIPQLKERTRELRVKLKDVLDVSSFDTTEPATGKASYNAGVIAHKKYTLSSLPDDAGLYADLADMEKVYKHYLDNIYPHEKGGVSPMSTTATYTNKRLCDILKSMLKDADTINRNVAALMVFGIVYEEYITDENLKELVNTAKKLKSAKAQIKLGQTIGKMQKEDVSLDVFAVSDSATPVTAADLIAQLDLKVAEATVVSKKEATITIFGIQNNSIMAANGIESTDISTTEVTTIDNGRRIADFLERFPKYAEKFPLVDANAPAARYAKILQSSYNVIFRGAPGTGKSYLAKSIAAYMVSENDGPKTDYESLSDDEKKRIGFVQFHPSYDYSDFVEGLRPVKTASNEIVFDRKDGIFKEFVEQAKKNYINSKKDIATVEKELSLKELVETFLEEAVDNATEFTTARGNKFTIPAYNDIGIDINIPNNPTIKDLTISMDELCKMLESTDTFNTPKDVKTFFKKKYNTQGHSYLCVLWKEITAFKKGGKFVSTTAVTEKEPVHNYVFIIDEINRGEISKILGELFFSIDPGYRGEEGSVFTQYSNMHNDKNEKFYIPENVYIIGTMNDIDRSVDTFDFAMRRRFRFIEIKADEHTDMLKNLEDDVLMEEAIRRMKALNAAITDTEGLNSKYHIGAAYFLKLKNLSGSSQDRFDALWTDYLEPLLQEYVNGMSTEKEELEKFKKAYTSKKYTSHKDGDEDKDPGTPANEDDNSTGTDEG